MSEHMNPAIVGDLPTSHKKRAASQKRKGFHPISDSRFFAKLAWTGIRNNRRFYLPYILTCTAMVVIYYIISFLTTNPLLKMR